MPCARAYARTHVGAGRGSAGLADSFCISAMCTVVYVCGNCVAVQGLCCSVRSVLRCEECVAAFFCHVHDCACVSGSVGSVL